MTTAAELLARTDCDDLRRENAELQRQNDILTGRVQRLNTLLVLRERRDRGAAQRRDRRGAVGVLTTATTWGRMWLSGNATTT